MVLRGAWPAFLLMAFGLQDQSPSTVAQAVGALGTDPAGLSEASVTRRITSSASLSANGVFALAYYEDRQDGRLHPPLFVALREPNRAWREVGLTDARAAGDAFGSVMAIDVTPSLMLLDTHDSPSAGRVLVLRRDSLALIRVLDGFRSTALPNGLVVFHRNMIHFAPAHPEELAVFDPTTGAQAQLYPTDKASPRRKAFMDRLRPVLTEWQKREPSYPYGFDPEWFDVSVGALEYDAASDTLSFPVVFGADRHPREIGPPLRDSLTVICRPMRSATRRCVESR